MKTPFFTLALLLFSAIAPAAEKPNVLFLISDDLNNYLGCYGDPRAKTPHLDALAERGVKFERAYCTYPLCGPSRNSMLTGLYPNSSGILTNAQIFRQTIPDHPSLSQTFRRAGYFAARIGKLYHYNVPKSVGTDGHDDPASWELELNPAGVDRLEEEKDIFTLTPGQFGGTLSWYASPKSDEHHTDAMLAKDAEWVLERCAKEKDRPFFLAVGFFRPHTPYVAPKAPYFDLYDPDEMPLFPPIEKKSVINHSCAPNCEARIIRGHIWIVAIREIETGEELSYDYGYDLEHWEEHPCRCGQPSCVGYIVRRDQHRKLKRLLEKRRGKEATR